ncbi:MAG: XdhC family aldehyde oxidoreductase maturation factor [Acetobacterium sp.]|uniref:XdhC family aldehyde oxidoreductase maturation factor n=1 Tax=Acetobacterium sp. TaxID=1872094 RepID=UPI00324297C4
MNDLLKIIKDAQEQRENFVMATILQKSGSTPRSEGARMIIKQDLTVAGTIGGGLVEAMVIRAAVKVHKNKYFQIEEFVLNSKDEASQRMVCGGDLKILLEYIDWWDPQNQFFYGEIVQLIENKTDFVTITKIPQTGNESGSLEKWVCTETGFFGSESDEVHGLVKEIRENFYQLKHHQTFLEKEGFYVETFFNNENVCIVGGGHIGKVLAELCKVVGFYVTVLDDREEFANTRRFNGVEEVMVIPAFKNIENYVKIDQYSYVVIVTRGHSEDKDVLAQILQTEAKYIGMIGSKKKRNHIYQDLLDEGFSYSDLERVHSPIGLNIFADTPEEIAVSIVAEMIQVRRKPI